MVGWRSGTAQDTVTLTLFPTPRLRKSPFYAATRRYGCDAFSVYNHMLMPVWYGDPEEEFWRLIEHVTLWDVACERQVEITGPDAARFVQLLTPRNLDTCTVGKCRYVILTAEDGGIINDPVLLRLGENHFWLSLADSDVLLWAKGVALNADMDVMIVEPDVSPLQVQGPKSNATMAALFGERIIDMAYYTLLETTLDNIPIVISRTGWSGEKGYEIFLRDGQYGDALWERVMEAGKAFNIGPACPSQIRRIEAGILAYGTDMTLTTNPFEIGMDRLVDVEQETDFIGKAALRKIKAEGIDRLLTGVEIEGDKVANEEHWPLFADGRRIGEVTSCVYSPRLEKNIGLAMVERGLAAPGRQLTVKAPHADLTAHTAVMPFFDPNKELPR